jgi:16S rRNA (adenine1518-N6/adenine1519-N6)-dimethyltransferase
MQLKRRYGQHFLRDTGIITRIVGFIEPAANDFMVEIGGGDAALSIRLAPKVFHLIAVEIDRDLIPGLKNALAPFPNAEILTGDILHLDLGAITLPRLGPGLRLRVVGNLPYNVGTAIVEKLLAQVLPIEDMTFMLQLETAERIAATPGSREYGFFSVLCQYYCDIRPGLRVSPACFVPRPKVQSAVIALRPRPDRRDPEAEGAFLRVAKAAFAYRRKKLANSLRHDRELSIVSDLMLRMAGIDGSRRPEELTVEEYKHLAEVFRQLKAQSQGGGRRQPSQEN